MKELLEAIARGLVQNPDGVRVEEADPNGEASRKRKQKIQAFLLAAGGAVEEAGACKGGRNQWRRWTDHSSRRFRRSQLSDQG